MEIQEQSQKRMPPPSLPLIFLHWSVGHSFTQSAEFQTIVFPLLGFGAFTTLVSFDTYFNLLWYHSSFVLWSFIFWNFSEEPRLNVLWCSSYYPHAEQIWFWTYSWHSPWQSVIESTEVILVTEDTDDDARMRFLGILYYGDQWHRLAVGSNTDPDPITFDLGLSRL